MERLEFGPSSMVREEKANYKGTGADGVVGVWRGKSSPLIGLIFSMKLKVKPLAKSKDAEGEEGLQGSTCSDCSLPLP